MKSAEFQTVNNFFTTLDLGPVATRFLVVGYLPVSFVKKAFQYEEIIVWVDLYNLSDNESY